MIYPSIHDGARAGRADLRIVWIVVQSLYSIDGDFAPLDDIVAIASQHNAFVMGDEAHATGVYGEQVRGLTACYEARENLVVVRTCGKAGWSISASPHH